MGNSRPFRHVANNVEAHGLGESLPLDGGGAKDARALHPLARDPVPGGVFGANQTECLGRVTGFVVAAEHDNAGVVGGGVNRLDVFWAWHRVLHGQSKKTPPRGRQV